MSAVKQAGSKILKSAGQAVGGADAQGRSPLKHGAKRDPELYVREPIECCQTRIRRALRVWCIWPARR